MEKKMLDGSAKGSADASRLGTILLVDGESYIRELMGAILSLEGYEVLHAGEPQEALAHANFGGSIDLILTNAALPVMHGPALVERIQELRPGTPALYMASREIDAVDVEDLMIKPFTPKAMVARVAEVLSRTRSVGVAASAKPSRIPLVESPDMARRSQEGK